MTETNTTEISLSALPPIGQPFEGGTFAGVISKADGTHCAVFLLPVKGEKLTWKKAINWAKKQGGELPTRPVAAMLFANVKPALSPAWHWTADEDDASFAWYCLFDYGYQVSDFRKSYKGSAVAVRLIQLTA